MKKIIMIPKEREKNGNNENITRYSEEKKEDIKNNEIEKINN